MTKSKLNGVLLEQRHGRVTINVRRVTVPCKKCGEPHTFVMTTKEQKYCPECREVAKKEKYERDVARVKRKRESGEYRNPATVPARRLIPYAGKE